MTATVTRKEVVGVSGVNARRRASIGIGAAVLALAALVACDSGSPGRSGGSTPSTPGGSASSASSDSARSSVIGRPSPTGSGMTLRPPNVRCLTGEQSITLDGARKPTELCLLSGAIVHLSITVPNGQTWSAPTVDDTSLVGIRDARGGAGQVSVTLRAISGGTVRVSVAHDGAVVWTLLVAVGR